MRHFLFCCGLFVCLLLTGCASNNDLATSTTPAATTNTAQQPQLGGGTVPAPANAEDTKHNSMQLTLYYASSDGIHLVPEVRSFPMSETPARTAVEALIDGTNKPQTTKVFPPGTKLRQLTIKDDIAVVDFNGTILKGNGGSATETLLVTSIVNTLTEFPHIEKVRILVDGKKVDTLYGHLDLTEPLSRSPGMIKK
jgi:germination protein M